MYKCTISTHYLGKFAIFKALVKGDPKPEVSWRRAKGTISDKDKFQTRYDDSTGEHILEVSNQISFTNNRNKKTLCRIKISIMRCANSICASDNLPCRISFVFQDSQSVCCGNRYI